jgi:hypothetical protein
MLLIAFSNSLSSIDLLRSVSNSSNILCMPKEHVKPPPPADSLTHSLTHTHILQNSKEPGSTNRCSNPLSLSPQPKKITVFGNLIVCFLKESRLQTGRHPCPGISRICNKESITEIQKKNEKCNQKQTTERQRESQRADLPFLKLLPQSDKP